MGVKKQNLLDIKLSVLTFILTENCNFNCSYCYQKKSKNYLKESTAERVIEKLLPFLQNNSFVNFYGGEPLLEFDKIKFIVSLLNKTNKKFNYSTSTNGYFLQEEILDFLNKNSFSILISFDGLAQNITRKKNSLNKMVFNIKKALGYPNLYIQTNSVFTRETLNYITKSIKFISELGIKNIRITPASHYPWEKEKIKVFKDEIRNSIPFLKRTYKKTGKIPLKNFRNKDKKGVFRCSAGKDRLSITPEGDIWGCYMFSDYFGRDKYKKIKDKFCFGNINNIKNNFKDIYKNTIKNFKGLSMDSFFTSKTFCGFCPFLEECFICPVNNLYFENNIKKIPLWLCELNKTLIKIKHEFLNTINEI